jgi:subtilisin family serine protease
LGGDRFQRVRLVRVAGKYPLRRREEVVTHGNGGMTLVSEREMVADHFLVSLDPAHPVDMAKLTAATGCTVRRAFGQGNLALLTFPYQQHDDYPAMQQRLNAQMGVRIAEPDWIVQSIGTPNDSAFAQLWGMNNIGQTSGTVDADIDAPEAWNICTGSKNVLVGIIDTGIDESHPDLAANMWTNPGETGLDANGNSKATNGLDDDGNGYIDDVHGWDFVNEDNNPHDDHYHGTHCAGTIGGVGNNGIGVAGVCWNVSMVGLKFLNASGSGATSDAVEAQLYANQIGCDITSNSWGGGGYSQALKDAIDAGGAKGELFVAAAGNYGTNNDSISQYPSNYDSSNIIAVAATDKTDALAYFSCYGAITVDLGAPGVDIYSCQPGGLYQLLSGTSMATPHVAGACALVKAANPSLTGAQIKAAILANVDPVASLAGKTVTGGRLNVFKAVAAVSGNIVTPSITFTENGNGDGLLNPGEQAVMTTRLTCSGAQTFTNLTGTITTADTAVTIESGVASFGTLNPTQSANGNVPFRVRLAAGTATPHAVLLTLNVTADGGKSWSFPASITYVTSATISGTVNRIATGSPLAGATVTWQGNAASLTPHGSLITGAAGEYSATVADGTYQLSATAIGMSNTATATATVPPAAVVNFALGASQLAVTPTTLALTAAVPTATVKIANSGDAPLTYVITSASIAATSGLWHPSNYRSASGNGSSWYYGSEATRNYDTGSRTYGALVFPTLTVQAGNPQLTFKSWRRTEVGGFYDQSMVQISLNGGLSWMTLRAITDISGTWQTVNVSLASYVGQSVVVRFYFDSLTGSNNAYEGWYIDEPQLGSVALEPWLMATPQQGQVAAGGSADVVVTFLTDQFAAGDWSGMLNITSNAPVNGTAQVSVTANKPAEPVLVLQALPTSDGAPGPGTGDGDGFPEAGESIALIPKWKNVGVAASGVITTTLSSGSSYIQIVTGTATTASIPVGGTADSSTPLLVTVDPATPDNTVIPLTLVANNGLGLSWTASSSFLVTRSSQLSGTFKNKAGSPLANVTVTAGGTSVVTAADGTYRITGIAPGSTAVSAAKTNYQTATVSITTPPDAVWSPTLLTSAIALDPVSIALTANSGSAQSATVQVANPGDAPLNFTILPINASTAVPTGLWHRSSFREVGGVQSWYYGSEVTRTYNTGTINSGTLTFSGIAVPAGAPYLFSWQQWRLAENSWYYDASTVQVSVDGSTWSSVYQTPSTLGAWESCSVSLAYYAGKTVMLRFFFNTVNEYNNDFEGWYVSDLRLNGTPLEPQWLSASPTSGTVAPGASMTVTVTGDSTSLPGGTATAPIVFSTNVPESPTVTLPVSLYVITPPALSAGTPTIGDSGASPIVGDGDGKAEPGETIAWAISLANSGNTAATGVIATLSSASPYLTFPASTSYGTINGGSSGTGKLTVAISPDCPSDTTIPVTCTLTADNGGPWTTTFNLLVKWDCVVTGVVTDLGTGLPLYFAYAGVYNTAVNTDENGRYRITGLPMGTLGAWGYKPGYVSIDGGDLVVTPSGAEWNFSLGIRDVALTPVSPQSTLRKGHTGTAQWTITNSDSIATTWSFSNLPSWLSVTPASGTTAPGSATTVTATFSAGTSSLGTRNANISLVTDASRDPATKPIAVSMLVKSAHAPTAAAVSVTVSEDSSKQIQLLGADADGGALTYTIDSAPQHGTATLGANGMVTYTPTTLYHGADGFTYRVSDGYDVTEATAVTITVTHVNHAPLAAARTLNAKEGFPAKVTLSASDPDGDTISGWRIGTPPAHGTATIANGILTYKSEVGFGGIDICTVIANDGTADSAPATVSITVTKRPVADALAISVQEGDPVAVPLHGTSPRNQALTYTVSSPPAVGQVSGTLPGATYTPPTGYVGTVTFLYTVMDAAATSYPAKVTITVNARPTAASLTINTQRELAVAMNLVTTSPRSLPLTLQMVKDPVHGTLSGAFPTLIYTPGEGYSGSDTWRFTVSDGVATSRPATITMKIKPGLPAAWSSVDIGDTGGAVGSTTQQPATGDMSGAGAGQGMIASADGGQFAYTPCQGDFDLVAQVPLPAGKSSSVRVGIAVRDDTTPGSRGVFVGLAGNKQAVWSQRMDTDGPATTSTYAISVATWVKISRRGNSLFSYRSGNGTTWTLCGRVVWLLPATLDVGTLFASGVKGTLLNAQVSQVQLVKPQAAAPGVISINFQSTKYAPVVLGGTTWASADGAVFGARWEGLSYGCDVGTTSTYNTDNAQSPDERYDTGVYAPLASTFEVAVPNGTYTVTVCVGDALSTTGKLRAEVEGVPIVAGNATATTHWYTGTVTVVVSDGRLTLRSAAGGSVNRWAWIQIVPVVLPSGNG